MPLPLSGAGSFSFFKGPSLTATPLISNNELRGIPTLSTTATASSKSEKTPSPMNSVVPTERRARSVDATMNRNRRGSNCSSRTNNKKPVWLKAFILRIQQTFLKFNNEPENQLEVDRDLPSQERLGAGASIDCENIDSNSLRLQPKNDVLSRDMIDDSSQHHSTSSVFEICAQTPRHKTKEPEVLRQVGRFTIVREREDFDTIVFDQCHCLQKPCKYSSNGGVHPPSSPKLLPELVSRSLQVRDINEVRQRQARLISTGPLLHHHQPQNPKPPSLTSRSGPPGVHGYTFYLQPPSISSSSRRSLPCLYSKNNNNGSGIATNITKLLSFPNTIPPASAVRTSRVMVTTSDITSTSCRKVLPTSSSSPNLMSMHNRSKNESVCSNNNNKSRPLSNVNIHVNGGGPALAIVRAKKPSIYNMHQDFLSNKKHNSAPTVPTPPFQISLPPKYSITQESHATISSHSGRKFEVELYSSSIASSNSSVSSVFTSSSPASTSSAFSFASSPGTNSQSPTTTLSRQRSSTLSSKHGRKFEVTVLPSDNDATKTID